MVVADPDEALIEAIAEAIAGGPAALVDLQLRDPGTASNAYRSARAAFAAMVEHLGLVEEWTVRHAQGIHPGPFTEDSARRWIAQDIKNDQTRLLRRLVSRWVEVEP
jgi:NAD(P)-dependent dehydrogenase (short-subunit alcohol dehydrogenase family)